jgi:hypothetical protein
MGVERNALERDPLPRGAHYRRPAEGKVSTLLRDKARDQVLFLF